MGRFARRTARNPARRASLRLWTAVAITLAYALWGCADDRASTRPSTSSAPHVGEWLADDDTLEADVRDSYRKWFGESCGPGPYPECDRCEPGRSCFGVQYGPLLVGGQAEGAMFTAFCADPGLGDPARVSVADGVETRAAVAACLCARGEYTEASRHLCEIQAQRTLAELRAASPASSQFLTPRTIRCGPRRDPVVAASDYETGCLARLREAFPDEFS